MQKQVSSIACQLRNNHVTLDFAYYGLLAFVVVVADGGGIIVAGRVGSTGVEEAPVDVELVKVVPDVEGGWIGAAAAAATAAATDAASRASRRRFLPRSPRNSKYFSKTSTVTYLFLLIKQSSKPPTFK